MGSLLEWIKEAPHVVVLGAVAFLFLPCLAKLTGYPFGFILIIVGLIFKREDMKDKDVILEIDFHGAKLRIGKALSNDVGEAKEDGGDDGDEASLTDLSKKIIDIKDKLK